VPDPRLARRALLAAGLVLYVLVFVASARYAFGEGTSESGAVAPLSPPARSPEPADRKSPKPVPQVVWRRSVAVGLPWRGRLENGVMLPAEGLHFFTWDPILRRSPNRSWRRVGHDRLVRLLLSVAAAHRAAHPDAPRLAIGDLSRSRGGDFGPRFGLPGHVSHQNGLDADVFYPRLDRREVAPEHPREIDRVLAQDLVDRFVRAGAVRVFVGPNTGLTGDPRIVQPLVRHDNHLHVRIDG
jgi:murein endopeptidase